MTTTPHPPLGPRCLRAGHPQHDGGCVIDDPDYQPAPPSRGAEPEGLPSQVLQHLRVCAGAYRVSTSRLVQREHARNLIRAALTFPERAREDLLTNVIDRLLLATGSGPSKETPR